MKLSGSARVRRIVESILTDADPKRYRLLASVLGAAAAGYGAGAALRPILYRRGWIKKDRLSCAVVAVGNITVGGTGKTPLVMSLARRVQAWGWRPVVVSRGYGGRAEAAGGVVSDGRRLCMDPASSGDEPFMMAAELPGIPVVVGRSRFRAGSLALERFSPDVVILDDAFQHLQLHRDLNLVVMDATRPFGNGRLLPRGPLREPARALNRADAFILTRPGGRPDVLPGGPEGSAAVPCDGRPVFEAAWQVRLREWTPGQSPIGGHGGPALADLDRNRVRGVRAVAFAGIARPERFVETLADQGMEVAEFVAYPDHHGYTDRDLDRIARRARRWGARMLVTTAKDWVRIFRRCSWTLPVGVADVAPRFGDQEAAFDRFLRLRLLPLCPKEADG